jgi:hypothetical protein
MPTTSMTGITPSKRRTMYESMLVRRQRVLVALAARLS